jgi:hypothetical protein
VDLAHALSTVPVAAFSRRHRSFAVGQIGWAVSFAILEVVLVGSGSREES